MVVTRSRAQISSNRVSKGRITKKDGSSKAKSRTQAKTAAPVSPPSSTGEKGGDGPSYYLMKSEPESRICKGVDVKYSIDDLAAQKDQTDYWDSVRNYEARNLMRRMRVGDRAFFYHANCKEPGVVGIMQVVREAYPDFTAWDPKEPHYDPKSTKENPRWWMVDVKLERKFPVMVSLKNIKQRTALKDMFLVKRGRLSVQPVRPEEWKCIIDLADKFAKEAK